YKSVSKIIYIRGEPACRCPPEKESSRDRILRTERQPVHTARRCRTNLRHFQMTVPQPRLIDLSGNSPEGGFAGARHASELHAMVWGRCGRRAQDCGANLRFQCGTLVLQIYEMTGISRGARRESNCTPISVTAIFSSWTHT